MTGDEFYFLSPRLKVPNYINGPFSAVKWPSLSNLRHSLKNSSNAWKTMDKQYNLVPFSS